MKKKIWFGGLLFAVLGVLLVANPASATTYDPTKDEVTSVTTTFATKSGPTRSTMKSVDALDARVSGTPSSSGCKEITATYTAKNAFGSVQVTFKQSATWCWKYGAFTYHYSDFTQSSPGTYWSYVKLISSTSSEIKTGYPWIRYRQAYFKHCLPSWMGGTCYNKLYPWFRFYMYGNGTYTIQQGV